MIDTVDLLLEYYEKGTSSNLFSHLQGLSSRDIRVVVIEILGWLKLEHKRELWIREGKKTNFKASNFGIAFKAAFYFKCTSGTNSMEVGIYRFINRQCLFST